MDGLRKGFFRYAAGSRVAVLMLHGICGSPVQFRELIPLVPKDWTLQVVLLDGHGGVEEFGASSMKKWKAQASECVEALMETHEQVAIVGHSMGALFAIEAAIRHPDRIPFLFLMAAPMRPRVRASAMLTCLRAAWGNVKPTDRQARAMIEATNIRLDRRLWKYIPWLPRMLELLAECRRVRRRLPLLKTPTWSFHSKADELVSFRSARDLEQHGFVTNIALHESGHFDYREEDVRRMQDELRSLIDGLKEQPEDADQPTDKCLEEFL